MIEDANGAASAAGALNDAIDGAAVVAAAVAVAATAVAAASAATNLDTATEGDLSTAALRISHSTRQGRVSRYTSAPHVPVPLAARDQRRMRKKQNKNTSAWITLAAIDARGATSAATSTITTRNISMATCHPFIGDRSRSYCAE